MSEIKLWMPIKDVKVSQPWGVDFWYYDVKTGESYWFYEHMGLPYHPGIDFTAKHKCPVFAANEGNIIRSGFYSDGGIGIEIQGSGFSTFYYHLDESIVKIGDVVKAGQLIGYCDNTGKYTTGDHLHFELRVNGHKINPAGLFFYTYNGIEINPKDYDKSRCYHRYYRGRPKGGLIIEARILTILAKKRIKPTAEKINALVYGGWDLESVQNDSMYFIWSQLKKDEYNKGLRPFC